MESGKKFKKLNPCFDIDGSRETANGGATSTEVKDVYQCECGAYVVWHKSKRTGKSYLANCFSYMESDRLWFAPNSPHFTTCSQEVK
jgi:hypothetical protein